MLTISFYHNDETKSNMCGCESFIKRNMDKSRRYGSSDTKH